MTAARKCMLLPLLGLILQLGGCGSGYAADNYVLPEFAGGTPAYALYHAYGDSITYGLTLADPATQAYPALVARAKGLTLTNYGIPGDQSCDVATRQIFAHNDNPSAGDQGLYTLIIGTNDVGLRGPGPYEAVFNLCQQAAIAWLAVPAENKVPATAKSVTSQGPTSLETANNWNALTTGAQNASISVPFALQTTGTAYLWYRLQDGSAGSFRYALDGSAAGTASVATSPALQTQNGSNNSLGLIRLTSVAAGTHVLTVTQLNSGANGVGVVAVGTVTAGSAATLPFVLVGTTPKTLSTGPACGPCDVYRADIRANVQLLAADGLNLKLFESGKYMLGTTKDMSDIVHPNAIGQTEMAHALLDALP